MMRSDSSVKRVARQGSNEKTEGSNLNAEFLKNISHSRPLQLSTVEKYSDETGHLGVM